MVVAFSVNDMQLIIVRIDVCCSFCCGIPIGMGEPFRRQRPYNLVCFKVEKLTDVCVFNHHDGLVSIGK